MLIGQSVTVIGGGIGGLATALTLALRGASVQVLEQADALHEVGAGIQISPNGWAVLRGLGIDRAIAAGANRGTAVRLRDFRRGAAVFTLPLTSDTRPWHFVHRADLVATLYEAALKAGVTVSFGRRIADVAVEGHGVILTDASGTAQTHGLTIDAGGLHSRGRAALNPKSRAFFTGQVAWRATLPNRDGLAAEAHVFMGPGRHLVRYPLRGGQLVNIVAVEERDAWTAEGWHHRDDPETLRRAFVDFCPEVRDLLARVSDVHVWGLYRHPVARVWHEGPLALMGDAAHPTLPFLAQGANMALEDAWAVAACLAEAETPTAAFTRYAELRRKRTARIVQAASDNAENYHLRPGPYRFAAHSALRLAARFAPHAVTRRLNWIYDYDVTGL